jgi:hypothetical protein
VPGCPPWRSGRPCRVQPAPAGRLVVGTGVRVHHHQQVTGAAPEQAQPNCTAIRPVPGRGAAARWSDRPRSAGAPDEW